MKGSLRLNSLWLRVLLHAAQVCVYEPAPVYTKLTTNARGMRRCARRGKPESTSRLSIGLAVSSLGPRMTPM